MTRFETEPAAAAGQGSRGARRTRQVVLALTCAAQFMVVLDVSVMNVALPTIQVAFAFDPVGLAEAAGEGNQGGQAERAADLFGGVHQPRNRPGIAGRGAGSDDGGQWGV